MTLTNVCLSESSHTMDPKNRIFIPKRLQSVLKRDEETGHRIAVLTRGFEGCLFLFSEEAFEEYRARMEVSAFAGPQARKMQRLFFSSTHRAPLDASGRLLIPEKLKELAGITREKDVVLVGAGVRIEVWAKDRWEAYCAEADEEFDGLDQVLMPSAASGPDDPGEANESEGDE